MNKSLPDYQALRKILQEEMAKPVSLEEAETIGIWLLDFYGTLAKNYPLHSINGVNSDKIK